MSDNAPKADEAEFERRLYEALALIERAAAQHKAAAESMRRAARAAAEAAENLKLPWWLNLAVILLAGLLGALSANWMTQRIDQAAYQVDQQNHKLIDEGRMLERVWPKLSPAEQQKLQRLDQQQ